MASTLSRLYFLLIATLSTVSCVASLPSSKDFEQLMGKELASWSYVQTEEDTRNLAFFRTLYEQNEPLLKQELTSSTPSPLKIPEVLHFIWLGPKPFPLESVENIKSWIARHPSWQVKFWTDRERPLPHPAMQKILVKDFPFSHLAPFYHQSENFAEKADLLRYEILLKEGGVYVDHDVKCLRPFTPLNRAYDFYCGLELPNKTPLSSSILLTNNLIGSIPSHPILSHCIVWLQDNWEKIEEEYPGRDRDTLINRIAHRTFFALGEAFKAQAGKAPYSIAFPAFYFNAPTEKEALWAYHQYAGTWFENETSFEKSTRQALVKISKKLNQQLLFTGALFSLTLVIALIQIATFCALRKKK